MTGVLLEDFSTELHALHFDMDWCAAAQVQHFKLSFAQVFCLPCLPSFLPRCACESLLFASASFLVCTLCYVCIASRPAAAPVLFSTAAAGHSSRLAYACGSVLGAVLGCCRQRESLEREGLG